MRIHLVQVIQNNGQRGLDLRIEVCQAGKHMGIGTVFAVNLVAHVLVTAAEDSLQLAGQIPTQQ